MKVKFESYESHYRTLWMEFETVRMINQRLLPHEFSIYDAKTCEDTCKAIKDMTVRGAGAIGTAAGYAMAQAALEAVGKKLDRFDFWLYMNEHEQMIKETRPTAQNLFYAVNRVKKSMYENASNGLSLEAIAAMAKGESNKIADEDAMACKNIGVFGEPLVKKLDWTKDKDTITILTHCNAGWLAFVDYGTALSPVYEAHRKGKKVRVLVDYTAPRAQGAKLTCWELRNEGIEHLLIPDTAPGYFMSKGEVDLVIVGADRITRAGYVANKIGTFQVATMAREFKIPFYVAAPTSTIDNSLVFGNEIPIEYRSEEEVLFVDGRIQTTYLHNTVVKVLVPPEGTRAINPAFDVTPNTLIKKIITEKGVIEPVHAHTLPDLRT